MSLKLYMHPLASYCWKVLLALYETGTPFESVLIDLSDPTMRATLSELLSRPLLRPVRAHADAGDRRRSH